jgi:hypothetical protein
MLVVEVVCTQLLVGFVSGQHRERTHDERVGDRHEGSFLAPAGRQTLIEGRQIGPFATCRRMGYLGQAGPQGVVALARVAGKVM